MASRLDVRAGERLTERQALLALLLPSANNIAALLAAQSPGGSGAFVGRMNSTARRLGMVATRYTDPSGFDDDTVSTATDQLKLARVAMRVPAFAQIVDERSAVLPVVGRVGNYNGLVGHDGYVGVKTGSDAAAGGCLVFAKRVSAAGRRLTVLGVVLGQRGGSLIEAALASARALGDSAAGAVRAETVLPSGTSVLSACTADGRRVTAITACTLREVGWGGLAVPVQVVPEPGVPRPRWGSGWRPSRRWGRVRSAPRHWRRARSARPRLGGACGIWSESESTSRRPGQSDSASPGLRLDRSTIPTSQTFPRDSLVAGRVDRLRDRAECRP